MSRYLKTWFIDEKYKGIQPIIKEEFYDEQHRIVAETGNPSRIVEDVFVLLFTTTGKIYIQKRSIDMPHNPGLQDKTIGAFVKLGDTPDQTVMINTVEELQIPSLVVANSDVFQRNYQLLEKHLHKISLVQYIDVKTYIMNSLLSDGRWTKHAAELHVYFGVYEGEIELLKEQVEEVRLYELDDLSIQMEAMPDLFTHDLHLLLRDYHTHIKEFVQSLASR